LGLILLLCCLLWLIDYQIAKKQFLQNERLATTLECQGNWAIWQQHSQQTPVTPTRRPLKAQMDYAKFQVSQITQISLVRSSVRGGAFQDVLGTIWQVYLTLSDRSELLLSETISIAQAFEQADQLSQQFAVPAIVLASEGAGKYAAEPVNLPTALQTAQASSTIRCQQSAGQWHIYSQWRLISTWQLLCQSLQRFGFLLFTVLVAHWMIQFGGLLHFCGAVWLRAEIGFEQFDALAWQWPWQSSAGLLLALAIILVKGAQLSRPEHLYVTPKHLTFFLDTKKINQLAASTVASILFLKQPFPSLLILAEDGEVEIRELQHENEFRLMLLQLEKALAVLRKPTI
jgi:hypothetical protein